jgi:hypothetical protein
VSILKGAEKDTPQGTNELAPSSPKLMEEMMGMSKGLKTKAAHTREDGVFTLKLDEGISLEQLCAFAQDMFPDATLADIGVWPADEGELVVSLADGRSVAAN